MNPPNEANVVVGAANIPATSQAGDSSDQIEPFTQEQIPATSTAATSKVVTNIFSLTSTAKTTSVPNEIVPSTATVHTSDLQGN